MTVLVLVVQIIKIKRKLPNVDEMSLNKMRMKGASAMKNEFDDKC